MLYGEMLAEKAAILHSQIDCGVHFKTEKNQNS